MSRRPNASQALALKAAAAAAAARDDEPDEIEVVEAPAPEPAPPGPPPEPQMAAPDAPLPTPVTKPIGRPKGRRPVAARQTVYLDDARHAALARIAEDRGRSIHSLILEGIDHVIGKPTTRGWQ